MPLEKRTGSAIEMRELVLVTDIVSDEQELYGYHPAGHYIVLNNVPWLDHPITACSGLITWVDRVVNNGPTQELLVSEG